MERPTTLEELGNLPAVRCKTCGRTIANLYTRFVAYKQEEEEAAALQEEDIINTPAMKAFERLGVYNDCCRHHLSNPARIMVGGYYYDSENNQTPNTFIMGEYGKNSGDPGILEYLRQNMTVGCAANVNYQASYKKTVPVQKSSANTEYKPSMQEQFRPFIQVYMQLNEEERTHLKLGLWNLFLYSMYLRGWKGPNYDYPSETTGFPNIFYINGELDRIVQLLNAPVDLQPTLVKILRQPSLAKDMLHNDKIAATTTDPIIKSLALKDGFPIFQSLIKQIKLLYDYLGSGELKDRVADLEAVLEIIYASRGDELAGRIDSSFIEEINGILRTNYAQLLRPGDELFKSNNEKMAEHLDDFYKHIRYTEGTKNAYRNIHTINHAGTVPVKQEVSLHRRIASFTGSDMPLADRIMRAPKPRILDVSRIMTITCYYALYAITGQKIGNFNPIGITSSEAGISFVQTFIEYKPFME